MAEFRVDPNAPPERVHKAIRDAIRNHDLDTGWVELNAARVVSLKNLGILPKTVTVYISDNRNGDNFSIGTFTGCTASSLTVAGVMKYARVLANR